MAQGKTKGARVVAEFFERMREIGVPVNVRGIGPVTPQDFQTRRDAWNKRGKESSECRAPSDTAD